MAARRRDPAVPACPAAAFAAHRDVHPVSPKYLARRKSRDRRRCRVQASGPANLVCPGPVAAGRHMCGAALVAAANSAPARRRRRFACVRDVARDLAALRSCPRVSALAAGPARPACLEDRECLEVPESFPRRSLRRRRLPVRRGLSTTRPWSSHRRASRGRRPPSSRRSATRSRLGTRVSMSRRTSRGHPDLRAARLSR